MLVVLLRDLPAVGVVLHNLLVVHSRQEDVGLCGVEADAVGHLAVAEGLDALAGLGVPQLHLAIEAGREEFGAIGGEADVAHSFAVTHEGAQTFAFAIDVPELYGHKPPPSARIIRDRCMNALTLTRESMDAERIR